MTLVVFCSLGVGIDQDPTVWHLHPSSPSSRARHLTARFPLRGHPRARWRNPPRALLAPSPEAQELCIFHDLWLSISTTLFAVCSTGVGTNTSTGHYWHWNLTEHFVSHDLRYWNFHCPQLRHWIWSIDRSWCLAAQALAVGQDTSAARAQFIPPSPSSIMPATSFTPSRNSCFLPLTQGLQPGFLNALTTARLLLLPSNLSSGCFSKYATLPFTLRHGSPQPCAPLPCATRESCGVLGSLLVTLVVFCSFGVGIDQDPTVWHLHPGRTMEVPERQLLHSCLRLLVVVVHVVVPDRGGFVVSCCLSSALLLERYRVRCLTLSTAPTLSSRQAHPLSACARDLGHL